MQTAKYVRKPFEVEAVRVTEENFEEVAKWCGGDIHHAPATKRRAEARFIKLRVQLAMSERQTKAFVGDWILYGGKSYKIYTNRAFTKSFDQVPDSGDEVQELRVTAQAVEG